MPKLVGSVVQLKPIRVQDPDAKWFLFLPSGGVIAGRSYRKTLFRSYKVLELLDARGHVVAIASPPYEMIRADRFVTFDVTDDDIAKQLEPNQPEPSTGLYV